MDSDRNVARNVVMAVLKYHEVLISDQGGHITLSKDTNTEVIELPDPVVSYRMLQRFHWKYGVPIHHFYHPEGIQEEQLAKAAVKKQ